MYIDPIMIKEGYISIRKHPEFDLYIHNYTAKAQYDRVWNETTLNCRGLILNGHGEVIAKPFSKFFNLGEYGKDTNLGELPSYKEFNVYEKLDGSLGIVYKRPDGKVSVATRGSFESEQALKGQEILAKKYPDISINPDFTYLFEIIYPENRIVVNYEGQEDLVLLTIIDNITGKDIPREDVEEFAKVFKFPLVKKYDFHNDFNKVNDYMKSVYGSNREGHVIQFDTGLRIKMKYEEYVRLHRIITGVNTKTVWEMLRDGQSVNELLDKVPDEFHEWLENTVNNFSNQFKSIEHSCKVIIDNLNKEEFETRKEVAKYIMEEGKPYSGILFTMYDKKYYEQAIWKLIKPIKAVSFKEEI